ncbi:VOC family protein [Paenibacillus silviterrae]|uniref:VOC family protein n=1 Tax=Paenibacillus silviterrae TaxID=3242194 RepID=UPI002543199F|nr:VOC family protein [Paenibacillus chinjuensis]
MKVTGFNHVTIRVSSLQQALHFYQGILGMRPVHLGRTDAYLEWGNAWICLIEKVQGSSDQQRTGVDHVAFHIDAADFPEAVARLKASQVSIVRGPLHRGGGDSVNFLDPDGTELELFTGTLADRMKVWV